MNRQLPPTWIGWTVAWLSMPPVALRWAAAGAVRRLAVVAAADAAGMALRAAAGKLRSSCQSMSRSAGKV